MDDIRIEFKDGSRGPPEPPELPSSADSVQPVAEEQEQENHRSPPESSSDQISLGTSPAPFQMPRDPSFDESPPRYQNYQTQAPQNPPHAVVLSPSAPFYYQSPPYHQTSPAALNINNSAKRSSQTASIREKLQQKRCLVVFFLIAIVLILCALVILLSVLGAIPCSFKNCSGEGLVCFNTPFVCKIQCKSGYKPNADGGSCSAEFEPISFFGKSCSNNSCGITNTICDSLNQCNCESGYYGDDQTGICQECGVSKQSVNLRVVGGIVANPYSWPAIGLLQFGYEKKYFNSKNRLRTATLYSICSVFLIDKKTLLTAAHCINTDTNFNFYDEDDGITYNIEITYDSTYPNFESLYTVFLGIHNLTNIRQSNPNVLIVKPKQLMRHEDYDTDIYTNDLGLIKLSSEIQLNDAIQVACLPSDSVYQIKSNTSAYLAGWGLLQSTDKNIPNTLYNVNLTIYDGNNFCKMYSNTDWSKQMCAGDYYSEKDSCNGDSGGPLFVYDESLKKFVAVGIVSYGKRVCGVVKVPSIYTRISYYLNWIRKNQYK